MLCMIFRTNRKKSFLRGVAYGFSQGVIFWAMAAIFRFGAYLVMEQGLSFEDMFK